MGARQGASPLYYYYIIIIIMGQLTDAIAIDQSIELDQVRTPLYYYYYHYYCGQWTDAIDLQVRTLYYYYYCYGPQGID